MAPVVDAIGGRHDLEPVTLVTGQHREQLDDALRTFGIVPDADLDVMTERQPLPELFARITRETALALPRLEVDYLLAEGKTADRMVVTGNTAVDAVRMARDRARLPAGVPSESLVAVTMHRRENLPLMPDLAKALARVAARFPQRTFVYPVHLNPAVRDAVMPVLSSVPNVVLDDPWDYLSMIALLAHADLVVTDSGGIQEEGAALGVPVAVLRNVTERPEGAEAGGLRLLGNDPGDVEAALITLLDDPDALAAMRSAPNPYGDGHAGVRVAQAVAWRLGLADRPTDWQPERGSAGRVTPASGSRQA